MRVTHEANNFLMTGLERTDNGMKQTSWPEVSMINQKNYYTFVNYRSSRLPSDLVHSLLSASYSPLFQSTVIPCYGVSFSLPGQYLDFYLCEKLCIRWNSFDLFLIC